VVLVRQVPVVLVVQVVQVVLVQRVPVALVVQVVRVDSQARLVQVLVAVLRAELQVPADLVVQVVAQVAAAVVALAVEPLVLSVKAVLAVRARLVSQSAQSAKSSNSALTRHHLVERLFHAVTALLFYVCVAVLQFKISPTRLTPLQVS
jgi:hypothetical protein